MNGQVLIAGIGNIFLGDDGFGVEVVRCLSTRELPANVRVKDFGIRGFDLACALIEPWDLVIMVDVITRGEMPGTIYVIELDAINPDMESEGIEGHGLHPAQAIQLAQQLGKITSPLVMVACEPAEFGGEDGQMGLSPPVESAVQPAVAAIESITQEFISTGHIRQGVQV